MAATLDDEPCAHRRGNCIGDRDIDTVDLEMETELNDKWRNNKSGDWWVHGSCLRGWIQDDSDCARRHYCSPAQARCMLWSKTEFHSAAANR